MSDEFETLIVNGEEVGDYNDDTISFGKWQMATVELWDSPKDFDAYQYDPEDFNEFYKPDVKLEYPGDVEDVDFTPGMNGIKTEVEAARLRLCGRSADLQATVCCHSV